MASETYSDQDSLHHPRTPSSADYSQRDHAQVKQLRYSPDIDQESLGYCIDWSNQLLDDADHAAPPSIDWEDICDNNLHSASEDSEADSNIIYQPESPLSEEAIEEPDCAPTQELDPNSAWAILAKKVFSQFTTSNTSSKVETMVPPKEDTECHNSVTLKEKREKLKKRRRETSDKSADCDYDNHSAKKQKTSSRIKRKRHRTDSTMSVTSSHTDVWSETHLELSQDLESYDASSVIDEPMSENSADFVQTGNQISSFCNSETYDLTETVGETTSVDCSQASHQTNTPPSELLAGSASEEKILGLGAPADDSLNWSNSKISEMIKHIRQSVERNETKKKPVLPDVCPRRLSVESNESIGTPELSYEVHGLEKMDTEEKFRNFLQVMRHLDGCGNPQLTIQSALTTALRNTLDLAYDVQQLTINDMVFYSGVLTIGGYFLSQSIGDGRETVQQAIYEEAFKVLKTKSFREIIALKDPWIEQLKISLQTKSQSEFCLKDEVEKLSNYIKANELVGDSEKAWFKAVKESGCLISPEISFAEKVRDEKVFYTAVLAVGSVFIAGCRGSNQPDMRLVCYSKALHALKTKTVDTLMESHNLSLVLDKPAVAESSKKDEDVSSCVAKEMSYEEKLEFIINHVRETVIHQSEIVPTLDKIMRPLGIVPKCVYLRMDENDLDSRSMVTCELYFDELFISSGEGSFKRAAQEEAYIQAWELLPTATATILITENQRLQKEVERVQKMKEEEAAESTTIPDILISERLIDRRRYQDSNIHLLEKYKKKRDLKRPLSELVVVEKEDWMVKPVKFAFKTLLQSATLSGLLLEWEVHRQDGKFGCVMKIQNEIVSNASTKLKLDSRTVASVKALIKLVDTQPVYRITKNGIRKMIPWQKVESCADELQKSAKVNAGKCLKKFRVSPQLPKDKTEWLEQAFKQHILKTMPNSTLKDALVGPKVPEDFMERVKVRQFLAEHELILTKNKDADESQKQYVLLTWQSEPSRIVSVLKQCGGLSGRYVLISREHAVKTYQDALKPG